MPSPQLSYSFTMPGGGLAGQLVDAQKGRKVSRTTDVSMPFGVFVAKGARERPITTTDPGSVKLPTSASDQIVGVLMYEHNKGSRDLAGALAVAASEVVSVLREGTIYVITEKAVNEGDPVFVRHAANGGNTQLGAATDTDDSTFTSLLANARFAQTTTAAGVAAVELAGSVNAMS